MGDFITWTNSPGHGNPICMMRSTWNSVFTRLIASTGFQSIHDPCKLIALKSNLKLHYVDRFKFIYLGLRLPLLIASVRVPINLHKMSTTHACALNDDIKRKLPVLINETGSPPQHLCKIACELNANYVSQHQESFGTDPQSLCTYNAMQFMPRKSQTHGGICCVSS